MCRLLTAVPNPAACRRLLSRTGCRPSRFGAIPCRALPTAALFAALICTTAVHSPERGHEMALDLPADAHQPLFGAFGALPRLRDVGFKASELTLDFGPCATEALVRLGLSARDALIRFDLDPPETRIGLSLHPLGALLGLR